MRSFVAADNASQADASVVQIGAIRVRPVGRLFAESIISSDFPAAAELRENSQTEFDEPPHIQAFAVDEEGLEESMRQRIFQRTPLVTADEVKPVRSRVGMILTTVILVGMIVGLAVGLSSRSSTVSSVSAEEDTCEDATSSGILIQCECLNDVVTVSQDMIDAYDDLSARLRANNVSLMNFELDDGQRFSCDNSDNQALWWLAEDVVSRSQGGFSDLSTAGGLIQRHSLGSFYIATSGRRWSESAVWMTKESVCEWTGLACNSDAQVDTMLLPELNLTGTIPSSISGLSQLARIELRDNALHGTIPSRWLLELSSLASFDVSNNRLEGPIPEIVNITQLALDGIALTNRDPNVTIEDIQAHWIRTHCLLAAIFPQHVHWNVTSWPLYVDYAA